MTNVTTNTSVTAKTWIACKLKDNAAITAKANEIAALFAGFVSRAERTLHIAIYDFRLDEAQGSTVIGALNALAERGVDVRVAYFEQPAKKNPRDDGGDPSPGTTERDFKRFHPKIQHKAIKGVEIADLPPSVKKEPIEGGGHLMHSKYMIRDGASVWMGSANFTTDAWSIQDNNVVQLTSPDIAKCYETDFEELWRTGRIAGTGKNDLGKATVEGHELAVAFSPGEGKTAESEIADVIHGAQHTVAIASMVISSGAILSALTDAVRRGVKVTGVYDGPEMRMVESEFAKSAKSADKKRQWDVLKPKLVAKWSVPYAPSAPHNFMHNKLVVVDGKLVATGSFNFSENATHNAENVVTLHDPALAAQYAAYVGQLVATYENDRPARAA